MMEYKSVIMVFFMIICTNVIFHSVYSAAIFKLNGTKAHHWFIHKDLYTNNLFNQQPQEQHRSHFDLQSIFLAFNKKRSELLSSEFNSSFGHDIIFNEKELQANKIIMDAKERELDSGLENPSQFNPSRHLFEVLSEIKQSKLYKLIRQMPKGGILHIHESSMVSTDFLVSLTYWPNLWQQTTHGDNSFINDDGGTTGGGNSSRGYRIDKFRFSRMQPTGEFKSEINLRSGFKRVWRLVSDVRKEMGATVYDEHVRRLFTLYDKNVNPRLQFKDVNDVWICFLNVFANVRPLLMYMPALRAFYKQALKNFYEDGVQYAEIRASLSKEAYDLDGNQYSTDDILKMYRDVTEEFKFEHPSFIGLKIIYSANKAVANDFEKYFNILRQLHKNFPTFVIGFDMVGQEDTTPTFLSFIQHILKLPYEIKLFCHAGETNWFGSIDENLIDAILIGCRRIGHGYALAKHPKIIELIKSRNIAVEVNPISNQVLKLVDDYRNHPASVLLAADVPVVISSDDPSFWEATPLSHDFYVAFLGIASRHSDLRTLKKFALNSFLYSSLGELEKREAIMKWQIKWDKFVTDVVHNHAEYI